jgi:predicted RNase H-like nuclease (RuvC/YqgF family)
MLDTDWDWLKKERPDFYAFIELQKAEIERLSIQLGRLEAKIKRREAKIKRLHDLAVSISRWRGEEARRLQAEIEKLKEHES